MKTKRTLINGFVIAVLLLSGLAWVPASASVAAEVDVPPGLALPEGQGLVGGCSSLLSVCPMQASASASPDFTFIAWVNRASTDMEARVFDFGLDATHFMYLTTNSNGNTLRFAIHSGGSDQRLEAPLIPLSTWTHVAVTLASGTATLYVNGLPAASGPMALNPSDVFGHNYFLGRSQNGAPYYKGMLDEVAVFDRGLGADEITEVYNHGWAAAYGKLLALHLEAMPAFGGNTVYDASGQRHQGTLNTADTANKTGPGKAGNGNALTLDGVDDYVALPANLGRAPGW